MSSTPATMASPLPRESRSRASSIASVSSRWTNASELLRKCSSVQSDLTTLAPAPAHSPSRQTIPQPRSQSHSASTTAICLPRAFKCPPFDGIPRRTTPPFPSPSESRDAESDGWSHVSNESKGVNEPIRGHGFLLADAQRNANFHMLFPSIPQTMRLIEDFACARQGEVAIQGRLYVSEGFLAFHSSILTFSSELVIAMRDIVAVDKKVTALVLPNAIQLSMTETSHTMSSFIARDEAFHMIYTIWLLSYEQVSPKLLTKAKTTQCDCSVTGDHLNEIALDCNLPGSPEQIYNLMFKNPDFFHSFLRDDQKLRAVKLTALEPKHGQNPMLAIRTICYIKPLFGPVGPKETNCLLVEEVVHCDFEDHVTVLTTTRTPDVPSGDIFSVVTRICITWASATSARIYVTTQTEWTGRSFFKSIVNAHCIEGQKKYHAALQAAMRAYIDIHQDDFLEGLYTDSAQLVDVTLLGHQPRQELTQSQGKIFLVTRTTMILLCLVIALSGSNLYGLARLRSMPGNGGECVQFSPYEDGPADNRRLDGVLHLIGEFAGNPRVDLQTDRNL